MPLSKSKRPIRRRTSQLRKSDTVSATPEDLPSRRLHLGTWAALLGAVAAIAGAGFFWHRARRPSKTPLWRYEVVRDFPHDAEAFTQGLTWHQGYLLEGTGKYGRSELRRVELETGKVLRRAALPDEFFGEGIAVAKGRIYQLTWKSGTAWVYDLEKWEKPTQLHYEGQGWGITFDGTHLITSDGTSTLRFRRPADFQVVREIKVRDGRVPVSRLNELEYVRGYILANIWYRDRIAVIDPATGTVRAWIDLSDLNPNRPRESVLNGIAYDADSGRLFVTGKNWPRVYELRVDFP